MSFLSSFRSDNSDNSDSEVPSAVRISRIVMWIQGLGMIVLAGLYVQSILSLRGLTGAELSKRFDGEITSQSEVSYSSLWLVAGTALVIGVTLAYCAWQLPTRARRIRQTALVAEGIFLALALVSGGDPISCVLGLLSIIVLISFLREPAKSWFVDEPPPTAPAESSSDAKSDD